MEKHSERNIDSWVDGRIAAMGPDPAWRPDVSRGLTRFRARRVRRQQWIRASGAVAATGALVMAFPSTRAVATRCVDLCVAGSVRAGQVVWSRFAPEDRRMAPDFRLLDAAGQAVRLSDFRGRVVLVNFWATWCPPCVKEMPWFDEFEGKYRSDGFVVLGVSMDESGWSAVRPFLARHPVGYRVVTGGEAVAERFGGVASLPATVLIDRQGRIASVHVGMVTKEAYEARVRSILEER